MSAAPPPTDEALAVRARGAHADAFAELARRYTPRLLALLTRTCGVPPGDAEDVAQDVWLRVWRALPAWEPSHFRGWLFTIARHAADDFRDRRGAGSLDALPTHPPARAAEVGAAAEARDEVARLRGCLEKLDGVFRAVFEGFAGGQTYQELAAAAGVPVDTIKSRLSRARERLRNCMGAGAG